MSKAHGLGQIADDSLAVLCSPGSPEANLLLSCARTTLDYDEVEKITGLLQCQLNWEYVLQKADEHFISPLVCRSLHSVPNAVPKEVLRRLDQNLKAHAKRNLFVTAELLKLLSLFEENGVRAISYKGPVLAATAYGSVVMRTFVDLDILIHEEDILRAKELLLGRGFQTFKTELTTCEEQARLKARDQKDIVFVHPDLDVRVELHWRIASVLHCPFDSGLLWQRLGTFNLGGRTISNINPEDMLLILCVHGAKHSFKRIQWICDIAELIRATPKMDWRQVATRAREVNCQRMLSLGLLLATHLLGAELPPQVRRSIESDQKAKALATSIVHLLFPGDGHIALALTGGYFQIGLKERLIDRAQLRFRYLQRLLSRRFSPNKKDMHLVRLPSFLSFLYYLIRPVRVAGIYCFLPLLHFVRNHKRKHQRARTRVPFTD